ncbi:lytic murein transglycosylase [Rhodanobacter sp. C03]|uniref:lytic murein transglycosylase n=1 Tax=Rhodanobacter sp. C03 TaxID=1945858 RepID=UPI0009860633|nr:lytic murein transglycosylase [Rhodanobacter sp. C03]OOG59474.1 lytic transglycosylase [Rhodanobacter sp. C03]
MPNAYRLTLTLACLLIAPCLTSVVQAQDTTPPALSQTEFSQCLAGLRHGDNFARISDGTWKQYTTNLAPDGSILPLLDKQPEFTLPAWDYIAMLVDQERVADGRAAYQQWLPVLRQIQSRYGVDPAIVVGVWGVESNFGKITGGRPLVQSLGTLSCFGRRQAYFRGEFAAALQILQNGDIAPDKLNGSWAGAFGQTQFMPSTFLHTAVDFDGDGHRDVVGSVPDALASTANFLHQAGYRTGEPWGLEVKLPAGYAGSSARKSKHDVAYWIAQGIKQANGKPLPPNLPDTGLLLPTGTQGPAFLTGKNFDTIYSYNASENYALAIAQLSTLVGNDNDHIGFVTPWPTDDPGLSRAENRELQTLLQARGYDIGAPDGLIGTKTRVAIRTEQGRLGMPVDGRAGQKMLAALRAQPSAAH